MTIALKVIEDIKEKIYSKSTVMALSDENITEYQRGILRGKIDMIYIILKELENNAKN